MARTVCHMYQYWWSWYHVSWLGSSFWLPELVSPYFTWSVKNSFSNKGFAYQSLYSIIEWYLDLLGSSDSSSQTTVRLLDLHCLTRIADFSFKDSISHLNNSQKVLADSRWVICSDIRFSFFICSQTWMAMYYIRGYDPRSPRYKGFLLPHHTPLVFSLSPLWKSNSDHGPAFLDIDVTWTLQGLE